jgi:hypothetical protein
MKVNIFFFRNTFPLAVSVTSIVNVLNFLGYESVINNIDVIITVPVNKSCNFSLFDIIQDVFFHKYIKKSDFIYKYNSHAVIDESFFSFLKKRKNCCFFFLKKVFITNIQEAEIKRLLSSIGYIPTNNFFYNVIKYIHLFYGFFFHIFFLNAPLGNFILKKKVCKDGRLDYIIDEFFFLEKLNMKNFDSNLIIGMSSLVSTDNNCNVVSYYENICFFCVDISDTYVKHLKRIFYYFLQVNYRTNFLLCENASSIKVENFKGVFKFLKFFFYQDKKYFLDYFFFKKKNNTFLFLSFTIITRVFGFFLCSLVIEKFLVFLRVSYLKCFSGWLIRY